MSAPQWDIRLRIVSETLSVTEITTMTGLQPDRSSERGSFSPGSSLARRFTSWEIESGLSATSDVSAHVSRIADRLAGHVGALRRAAELADGFELSIVGRFDPTADDSPGVNLTDDHLSFLASVHASLDLEIIPEPPAASGGKPAPGRTSAEDE
jgi:hypothetical protein